jgi:hypothetical protein
VNTVIIINAITIRNINLPPIADDFAEEFTGIYIISLINFLSGYDQAKLAERCRDITAFITPIRLLRQTTLPQDAINSVTQFVRIVIKILEDLIPDIYRPFLDDIGVKGLKTDYNREESASNIRRFILKYIINLDRTLTDLECTDITVLKKSASSIYRVLRSWDTSVIRKGDIRNTRK